MLIKIKGNTVCAILLKQLPVTHVQCDARPTVTFPATEHHRPLTGTNLYCLVAEAHVCQQLAKSCYVESKLVELQ